MIEKYKDEILQSFLENYNRIYLVDLEEDTIVKVHESEGKLPPDPVDTGSYSEFNSHYSTEQLEHEYSEWRMAAASIENIRRVLTERSSFTLSYPLKDGRWMKVDNRLIEKKNGIPVKMIACVRKPRAGNSQEEGGKEGNAEELNMLTSVQQQSHAREKALRRALRRDAVAIFELNVTRDMVLSADIRNSDLFEHIKEGEITGSIAERAASREAGILSDNREQFREFNRRESLLAMYRMGQKDPLIEYLVKDRFGNRVWIRESVSLSKNDLNDDIMGAVILRDVTQRKMIETENQRRLELIRGLSRDYESVYVVDLETDSYDIYRVKEEITAKYRNAFSPSYTDAVENFAYKGVYRQDRENFMNHLSIENAKKVLSRKSSFMFTFRSGNTGMPQYYQAKAVRIGSPDSIQMLLGFANIEEERQEELRKRKLLEDALEQARHAADAKSAFLSNMSHDIRTPMNAIIGFANIAAEHIDDREKVIDCLGKIRTSSEHLLRLINNVLDMSRIESGRVALEESWVSLRDIIDEVTDLMKPEILSHRHEYEIRLSRDIPGYVLCDRLRMTQLLLNLLSNAVKYTPPQGRIRLEVSRGLDAPSGYSALEFVVSDTGIGMSRDFQKRMFEPFEREHNSTVSKVMGSGLGMPICKGIVDSMGGSMTVDSQQGRGSVITVNLALRSREYDGSDIGSETVKTAETEAKENGSGLISKTAVFPESGTNLRRSRSGAVRVLLVEDNELNREIAQELLEDIGYTVETAEDGETAIVMISRSDRSYYDVVLMDIQMPGIDGYEASKSIRKLYDKEHAQIPIIAMTANAYDEDMEKARSAGMNAYIAKPVDPGDLRRILEQVLGREEGSD